MNKPHAYLGDGVYATFDGYHVWLDCRGQGALSDGPDGHPAIALEPPVITELVRFRERCLAMAAPSTAQEPTQ